MTSPVTKSSPLFHTHCEMQRCRPRRVQAPRFTIFWESVHQLLNDQFVALCGCIVESGESLEVHLGSLGSIPEQVSHTTMDGKEMRMAQ